MATVEKVRKKKGKKIAPGVKDGDTPGQESKTGSLISVREAQEDAKADTIQVYHGVLFQLNSQTYRAIRNGFWAMLDLSSQTLCLRSVSAPECY